MLTKECLKCPFLLAVCYQAALFSGITLCTYMYLCKFVHKIYLYDQDANRG